MGGYGEGYDMQIEVVGVRDGGLSLQEGGG